jgi:glycosyltransferase involved in cell wall biosynthesis
MALLVARLSVNKEKLWHWRNGVFQKLIPQREIEAADVVVGFDTSAWIIGERAKRAGKKFVLDQTVGHPLSRAKAVREAGGCKEMWPEALGARASMVSKAESREHELADIVVAASSFSKKTLIENGVPEAKIRVLPYGVGSEFVAAGAEKIRGLQDNGTKGLQGGARGAHFDREHFDNLKEGRPATSYSRPVTPPFRFLYAGYLTKRKGIDVLLRAWSALQNVGHGARSMELGARKENESEARGKGREAKGAGQEDKGNGLEALGAGLAELRLVGGGEQPHNLPPGVVCLGQTPREALLREMSEADVFVFPSLFEGFALVILEAMAAGLPVITTPNTAGPDLIEDGKEGLIVPAGDANALREAMQSLLHNPERARSMGRAAHEKANEFTWERYGDRWEALVRDLCREQA